MIVWKNLFLGLFGLFLVVIGFAQFFLVIPFKLGITKSLPLDFLHLGQIEWLLSILLIFLGIYLVKLLRIKSWLIRHES